MKRPIQIDGETFMIQTVYDIPAPNMREAKIVVYGDPSNAWYEWQVIQEDRIIKDTIEEGSELLRGRQYGQAEIALRDALIFCTHEETDVIYEMPAPDKPHRTIVVYSDEGGYYQFRIYEGNQIVYDNATVKIDDNDRINALFTKPHASPEIALREAMTIAQYKQLKGN